MSWLIRIRTWTLSAWRIVSVKASEWSVSTLTSMVAVPENRKYTKIRINRQKHIHFIIDRWDGSLIDKTFWSNSLKTTVYFLVVRNTIILSHNRTFHVHILWLAHHITFESVNSSFSRGLPVAPRSRIRSSQRLWKHNQNTVWIKENFGWF